MKASATVRRPAPHRAERAGAATILALALGASPRAARGQTDPAALGARGPTWQAAAYVQGQYEWHRDSEDQIRQGGALLNQNRFALRRGRVRLGGEMEYGTVQLELDASTSPAPRLGVVSAFAALHYRAHADEAPLVGVALGLQPTPFGYELTESPRSRWFLERTQGSRAFFPGESTDLGVRVFGTIGFLRWSFVAMNGEPVDARTGWPGQDPNDAKEIGFRFAAVTRPREDTTLTFGVSGMRGRGTHPGTDAVKERVEWRDVNEDGVVQSVELFAVGGAAAQPSVTFDRFMAGLDVVGTFRSRLGEARLSGELVIAKNMDRGLFPADPVLTGVDARALAFHVALTQEIFSYAVVGARYDHYDPNADALDARSGKLLPFDQAVRTISPLVGAVVAPWARLLFQYDHVEDALGRDARGVPTDLANDAWTVRLQGAL